MYLFYSPFHSESTFNLSLEESLHCVKALRFKNNDEIHITNGKGKIILAKIIDAHPKAVVVETIQILKDSDEPEFYLHLAVAPVKNTARYEWFVEKATEFGVREITPIITSKTEKKNIRIERLQKIALEAMKQSNLAFLPNINEVMSITQFLHSNKDNKAGKYIAWCNNTENKQKLEQAITDKNAVFLVGPEGDFTKEEVDSALDAGFQIISLGSNRLRTETAALYLSTIMYYKFNKAKA